MMEFQLVSIRGERMNPNRKVFLDPLKILCVNDPFETAMKPYSVIVSDQGFQFNVEGGAVFVALTVQKEKERIRKQSIQTIRVS